MLRSRFPTLLLALLFACDRAGNRQPDSARAAMPDSIRPSGAQVESLPPDVPAFAEVDIDTLRVTIDRLEARLGRASEAQRPRALFELGRAKKLFHPDARTPLGDYAKARPTEFFFNEVGGNYLYTGKHFKEIVERYPGHELVDDAEYEMTLLPMGGECEGFTTCYIGATWNDVAPFLKRHPTSPYASRGLDRAVAAFTAALKDIPDLARPTESYDPRELRGLLASFDSVRTVLRPPLKTRADSLSDALWSRVGRGQ
ncbi:MAG: hypothetical protein ACRENU_03155 [Gemmatimonadaceae bacterium]